MISQTVVEPFEPIPQPVVVMPIMDPPAEFEVINPPENYVGPMTNVPVQPVMISHEEVQETSPDDFYSWVTRNDDVKAENVLFKRA